jgi:hypothetical protein
MAYPIPVPAFVEKLLTTLSSEELVNLRNAIMISRDVPADATEAMVNVIRFELTLREHEPLRRKAGRFYRRHSEEIDGIAKLAAVFAAAFGGAAAYDHFRKS